MCLWAPFYCALGSLQLLEVPSVYFEDNAGVIVNDKGEMKATREKRFGGA